jgi:hypothetical protein
MKLYVWTEPFRRSKPRTLDEVFIVVAADSLELAIATVEAEQKYSNNIDHPEMRIVGQDYDEFSTKGYNGTFIPNEEVIENITFTLRYFKYVREFLEKHKEHPWSIEQWTLWVLAPLSDNLKAKT